MATSLFPGDAAAATAHKPLVEFRCGRMDREGNRVKPDVRKGLLYMDWVALPVAVQMADDLLHLYWKDRQTGTVDEDLILFPNDATFERVEQCTTGRVYVLKFSSSDRRHFFWMQEPKADKDNELVARVNQILSSPNPASLATGRNGPGTPSRSNVLQPPPYVDPPPHPDRVQSPGGGGQSARTTGAAAALVTPPAPTPASDAEPLSAAAQLQGPPAAPPTAMAAPAPAPAPAPPSSALGGNDQLMALLSNLARSIQVPHDAQRVGRSSTSLNTVLSRDNIAVLLDNPAVCERLYPLLPDNVEHTRAELEAVIRSPQFHQAVAALDAGLRSGEVAPLVAQLGLNPDVGGPFGGVDAFLQAIRDQVKHEQSSASSNPPNAPPS